MDEEMKVTPETIKAEIEEMVKNHPHLVVEVVTENIDKIIKNVHEDLIIDLLWKIKEMVG